jgi:hypothetical protein
MQSKLKLAASLLMRNEDLIKSVQIVSSARVPVLKVYDSLNSSELLDLSVNNLTALENSALVKLWCSLDHRVRPLGRFIKHWASQRNINDRSMGTLSTYTLVLQLVFLLQQKQILPTYDQIEIKSSKASDQQPWDEMTVRPLPFETDIQKIKWSTTSSETVGEILIDFFKFFGSDEVRNGVEIDDGKIVKRGSACEGVLVMRCPLTGKNVNPLTTSVWLKIHDEFVTANELMSKNVGLKELVFSRCNISYRLFSTSE